MKSKLFILMFVMIFLVGSVSANPLTCAFTEEECEWDNARDYNADKRQITVTNSLGFGEQIATIKLLSADIEYVSQGYRKVAEFEVINGKQYTNVFNRLEFFDLNLGNKRIQRDFDYKIEVVIGQKEVIDYATICDPEKATETSSLPGCNLEAVGSHVEDVVEWRDFEASDGLLEGTHKVSIWTLVQDGDYVDWIPTLFGERIREWAAWTTSLDVGLQLYWTMNESSVPLLDSAPGRLHNSSNITFQSPNFGFASGVNASYTDFSAVRSGIWTGSINHSGAPITENWTVSLWINSTAPNATSVGIMGNAADSAGPTRLNIAWVFALETFAYEGSETIICSTTLTNNTWHHYGLTGNISGVTLYANGVRCGNTSIIANLPPENMGLMIGCLADGTEGTCVNDWFVGGVDEFAVWNRTLSSSEISVLAEGITIRSEDGVPRTTLTSPRGIVDYHKSGNNISVEFTIVDINPQFCAIEYDNVNISFPCSDTTLPLNITDFDIRELKLYVNDSDGNSVTNTTTWSYDVFERIRIFNSTAFETDNVFFQSNITFNNTAYTSITSVLSYNSINRTVTLAGSGSERTLISEFIIPPGIGINTFNWTYSLTNATGTKTILSNSSDQSIAQTNFTECGAAPFDIPYINFTFFNETSGQERVNATLDATFTFHLGTDADINKTLSFVDVTENPNYIFCVFPQNRTLNVNGRLDYNNGASQQRTFTLVNSLLTNVTTNVNLFLLPTSAGVFTSYNTIESTGTVVTGVLAAVSRVISGVATEITSGTTDGAGLITFFLNPDLTYDYIFSKTGFADNVFSLQPNSPSIYVITMTSTAPSVITGIGIANNLTFNIIPTSGNLSNQTTYTFGVNVSSGNSIGAVTLVLRNTTNDIIGPTISGTGVGFTSGSFNVQNNTRIIGTHTIISGNETITGTTLWTVGNFYTGSYSLDRQAKLFLEYEFRDFTRILLVLIIIMGIMIFMARGETFDSSESKIMVLLLLVWMFSLFGWLDTGLSSGTGSAQTVLSQFGNQYGIAILTSIIGTFFILRRVFIRRI